MMLTLVAVVASQIAGVGQQVGALLLAIPVFVLFAAVMVPIGPTAGKVAGLDVPSRRAIVFSGATRNSLVVLPLVLALPVAFDLAPLVVVTQTLVELIVMVVFVRLIPRLIPTRAPEPATASAPTNSRPQIPGNDASTREFPPQPGSGFVNLRGLPVMRAVVSNVAGSAGSPPEPPAGA